MSLLRVRDGHRFAWTGAVANVAGELRTVFVVLVSVAATLVLGVYVDRVYPLQGWLFFRLAAIYGWQVLLTCACAMVGQLIVRDVLRIKTLSILSGFAFALPVGLVAFALGMFVAGYLGWYGPVFSVAWPLTLVALGSRSTWHALGGRIRWPPSPPRGLPLLAAGFGVVCLFLLYLELISPDALNYDSTWSHLVIAQDYARNGKITPFIADWNKNVPHLASVVNTWGFIVPGAPPDHPTRWMMALHTEFTMFLWTLVGISAAVEWFAGIAVPSAWAGMFLFPGFFVYDANLGGSSDHFSALFAAPLLLAAVLAADRFEPSLCALTGILAAGALMTKFQAVYIMAPITVLLFCRWLYLMIRSFKRPQGTTARDLVVGPLLGIGCVAVVASPQFLENWIAFSNPFYPLAQRVFRSSTPTMPGAAVMVDYLFAAWQWHPPEPLRERIWYALRRTIMFPFEPSFFVSIPSSVGFLFPLLLPVLPLLPKARRIWPGLLIAFGTLFTWAMTFRSDRNLQTFLPILVVVTIAILARAWRLGGLGRLGIALLVGLQIVWGADAMFSGSDRLAAGVALIKSGYDGHASERFDNYRRGFRDVGHALPKEAVALLHNSHVSLGINRTVLLDWVGFQGLIDYRTFSTPRQLHDRLAALGVTHLIVQPGVRPATSKQEEVIFDTYAALYASPAPGAVGGFALHAISNPPPPVAAPFRVLTLGMPPYGNGIYPVSRLDACEQMPPRYQHYNSPESPLSGLDGAAAALATVDAALVASTVPLPPEATQVLRDKFRVVASYASFVVYARVSEAP